MTHWQPWRFAAALLAALASAPAVRAGNDMFGSLPGRLTASVATPGAGQTVTLTLRLMPTSSISHLKVLFEAPGCAVLKRSEAQRRNVSLVAGQDVEFKASARMAGSAPCKVVATVVQLDEPGARTGWIYAIVLNEAPPAKSTSTPGHDAKGRATIDAVAH